MDLLGFLGHTCLLVPRTDETGQSDGLKDQSQAVKCALG